MRQATQVHICAYLYRDTCIIVSTARVEKCLCDIRTIDINVTVVLYIYLKPKCA